MSRILAILILAASPAIAAPTGTWCPADGGLEIVLGPGPKAYIDGVECPKARIAGGRLTARVCYPPGGHPVPYDVDLVEGPDGTLRHDGQIYRRAPGARCP